MRVHAVSVSPTDLLMRSGLHDTSVYHEHEKLDALRQAVERGQLTPRVAEVFDVADAVEAHRRLEAGGVRGRFVLTF